jgi:hypothetical protein
MRALRGIEGDGDSNGSCRSVHVSRDGVRDIIKRLSWGSGGVVKTFEGGLKLVIIVPVVGGDTERGAEKDSGETVKRWAA